MRLIRSGDQTPQDGGIIRDADSVLAAFFASAEDFVDEPEA